MSSADTLSPDIKKRESLRIDAPLDALSERLAVQIEKNAMRQRLQGKALAGKAGTARPPHADATIKSVIQKAMHSALAGSSARSRQLRMDLLETLIRYERVNDAPARKAGKSHPGPVAGTTAMPDDPLLSTAAAGKILGFSRMYVTMLVDAGKLAAATVSAGGHRRIRQSEVVRYRDEVAIAAAGSADYKAAAREAGMYDIAEQDYLDITARPAVKKARPTPRKKRG